jgi:SAM-dependent methyltransferase
LNKIPAKKYEDLMEFLAFLAVYDDEERMRKYVEILEGEEIKGKTVVELGAGFGYFSILAVERGARKVYAVERNREIFEILKERVRGYKNIVPIRMDAQKFKPKEEIDILIHDFYGPLLYDESLYILDHLKFKPKTVIPNGGSLKCGTVRLGDIKDPTVDLGVLRRLKGVLVADLFDFYGKPEREFLVAKWEFGRGLEVFEVEVPRDGEVLVFWVEILHEGKKLCSSYECRNWPLVFTYNVGGRFSLSFRWRGDYSLAYFRWII